jgi:hypothetical protein
VLVSDRETGALVEPAVVDRYTLKPLSPRNVRLVAGPGAGPQILARVARTGTRSLDLSTDAEGATKT